jgi:hypothetical protein
MTAAEVADAAENNLLWTDQDVQRGIRPEVLPKPARELPLSKGYPDPAKYIFDVDNADDITMKLLRGEKLFLSPLIWNLRPGTFEAFADAASNSMFLYSGRIYLPDSHHRQQAILRALRAYRESPHTYPKFAPTKEFKLEVYFLSREDEGNYFFDKNQRPKPTSNSKAYDLTTLDDLSLLAKEVIDKSKALDMNVNRVTDRLTASNPQVVTLSTLREMMKRIVPNEVIDRSQLEGTAVVAGTFYDLLAEVRPELGHISLVDRQKVRDRLIVDAATTMHGYAALMAEFNEDILKLGTMKATSVWRKKLEKLSSKNSYKLGSWKGDLFDKKNPLWQRVGIVKPSKTAGSLTVINTGGARAESGRVLSQLLALNESVSSLEFLAK